MYYHNGFPGAKTFQVLGERGPRKGKDCGYLWDFQLKVKEVREIYVHTWGILKYTLYRNYIYVHPALSKLPLDNE